MKRIDISKRRLVRGGLATLGASFLSGCDRLSNSEWFGYLATTIPGHAFRLDGDAKFPKIAVSSSRIHDGVEKEDQIQTDKAARTVRKTRTYRGFLKFRTAIDSLW